jgi:hypothetical protein
VYRREKVDVQDCIPTIEQILDGHRTELGNDYLAYKNHVYRMINFCFALRDRDTEERQKIVIAGCFHDLGIWTAKTFDYLPPSAALAKDYLHQNGRDSWLEEVDLMIGEHHRLRTYHNQRYPLVEVFRQGDLIDLSWGFVRFGLPGSLVKSVKSRFPDAGFHKRLVELELGWLRSHPLRPVPVLKW